MNSKISSNTVFHFTKSINTILSILKNDFYPQFCFEDFLGTVLDHPEIEKGVPMVCFCDIPLSQISKHIHVYGEYALGLSKEWAIKNKINPVLYTYSKSDFADKLKDLLIKISYHEDGTPKLKNELTDQFNSTLQYVKPYEGRLWKNGKWTKEKIRFYDEREWRFIPKFTEVNEPVFLRKPEKDWKNFINGANKIISEEKHLRLSFEPKDIKYIIVKNESEILEMHDKVIEIKRDEFSYKDIQILTTRIISMESIRGDF
jgi:hypothetical protein